MLFNSFAFLSWFLPVTWIVYYLIGKTSYPRLRLFYIISMSLFFYAWANPVYLLLLSGSIAFNFICGKKINSAGSISLRKWILAGGLMANILLLGFFKYSDFFIENVNNVFHANIELLGIALPLAISFFTIQQIAYLVDIYRGEPREHSWWEYFIFVSFFPKLISGPIVRIKEMMPQFRNNLPQINSMDIYLGITIFFLGLFKKVILADTLEGFASPVFGLASHGGALNPIDAWGGALAYTCQLYFDFSGYCDMAIGIGLLFGFRIPLNFYSPYKARSIIDFWRRWHITLSKFIRDYIYIPLGGNHKGFFLQMVFLLVAMTIAGIWHGAGWTFVIWGALHGFYLIVNHTWRKLAKVIIPHLNKSTIWNTYLSILITFVAVTVAWVFFRSDSVATAIQILKGMIGVNGFSFTPFVLSYEGIITIIISLGVCWLLPNVQEYFSDYQPTLDSFPSQKEGVKRSLFAWKPTVLTVIAMAIITAFAIVGITQSSNFLYFQF